MPPKKPAAKEKVVEKIDEVAIYDRFISFDYVPSDGPPKMPHFAWGLITAFPSDIQQWAVEPLTKSRREEKLWWPAEKKGGRELQYSVFLKIVKGKFHSPSTFARASLN
jgi:hypothetical protein